jgi:hypothetical protein
MAYGVGHSQDSEAERKRYTSEANSERRALVRMPRRSQDSAATAAESQNEGPEKLRGQTVGDDAHDGAPFADERQILILANIHRMTSVLTQDCAGG